MNNNNIANIPAELKMLNSWVAWKSVSVEGRDKPTKIPYQPLTGYKASPTNPDHWSTFNEALDVVDQYDGIGFVLSGYDPFCFIDMDNPNNIEDPEQREYWKKTLLEIYNLSPDTYTEISPSGKGLHILVRADINLIPSGLNNGCIEAYTHSRYMTVTGDAKKGRSMEIVQADDFVRDLCDRFKVTPAAADPVDVDQFETPETMTDEEVVSMASGFKDGDKFVDLYEGRWEEHYASQSDADMSLVNMIQTATKNRVQIKRIFLASQLGQRPKAHRPPNRQTGRDYVDDMVVKSFDRELPLVDISGLQAQYDRAVAKQKAEEQLADTPAPQEDDFEAQVNLQVDAITEEDTVSYSDLAPCTETMPSDDTSTDPAPVLGIDQYDVLAPVPAFPVRGPTVDVDTHPLRSIPAPPHIQSSATPVAEGGPTYVLINGHRTLNPPPNLIGRIGARIYSISNRPSADVAIAGALGIMSGICGRAFTVNRTGLNLYITLIGRTGIGKESISDGISELLIAVAKKLDNPDVMKFVAMGSHISSGPALMKHLLNKSNSFVSVQGEMGILLGTMHGDKATDAKTTLRREILSLFGKSGPNKIMGGAIYAKEEDCSESIISPNFGMVGETTPKTYYEAVTEDLVHDGFLPRNTFLPYDGTRVNPNRNLAGVDIPEDLVEDLSKLAHMAMMLNEKDESITIQMTPEAEEMLYRFGTEADIHIRESHLKGSSDSVAELWNRSQIKVLRIAGLIACGGKFVNGAPLIDVHAARWAIDIERESTQDLIDRFESGHIGVSSSSPDDLVQIKVTKEKIREFFEHSTDVDWLVKKGNASVLMAQNFTIPRSYFTHALTGLAPFRKDRRNAKGAMDAIISGMVEDGILKLIPKTSMMSLYESNATGYQVVDIQEVMKQEK